jgi:sucrose-6-phosphate hydrolase SacC (GH32 family)
MKTLFLLLMAALTAVAQDYTSRVPKFQFAGTLPEQEAQLKSNPLMLRFAESRQKMAGDPHRPIYHFVSPESSLNDPNGLCFWQGRWHLFYQGYPPEDKRQHWGHAVSDDLVHWRDLPYAIYPNPEEKCYSGATLVEDNRVIAMYHGTQVGNMVAVSSDPLLLNWEKVAGKAVIPIKNADGSPLPYRVFDPCIWKKDGLYYALSGGTQPGPGGKTVAADFLFRSKDLVTWEYLHPFTEGDRFTLVGDDGACPYFWPIANRHMLLFFSHMSGGQYLLGDYDKQRDKLVVTAHGKFNHGAVSPAGTHAPSAAPDGKGGVIAIFNMNPGKATSGWNQIMTLPRRLTLSGKEDLSIEPAGDIESLRGEHRHVDAMKLPANEEIVLPNIRGNAMEIVAEIDAKNAPLVELNVLRSPNKEEFTRIALFKDRGYRTRWMSPSRQLSVVSLDSSYSSTLEDARSRPPENAQVFVDEKEPFKLRVFVDRSVVEVFVNGRQCLAIRVYPGRSDSLGVSLRMQGRDAALKSLDAWQMKSIYPRGSGDIVLADFEGKDYGAWKTTGEAFGSGPAQGTLPRQMRVEGFQGKGLVNSFYGGDKSTGTLTSPEFKIERKFITFLIGGGGIERETCMNLLVGGKVVRTATGPNILEGGSEELAPSSWDVAEFAGKTAQIQIVDNATGGWGHINVDQIVLSDKKPAPTPKLGARERELTIDKQYLHFPVKNAPKKGKKQRVAVLVDGAVVREFETDLSDQPDWFAHLDMSAWRGKKATVRVEKLAKDSKALELVAQADTIWNAEQVYREPLRAQLHFSPRRGWNNDPNGMVFADGEYHLYFQHNPYGWPWGNMHWGHAVSRDMVHWEELPIAIYPFKFGDWAYSGSAVVDKNNTSGWKKGNNELIVAAYTSTGRGECIVYSNDRGRTFQEFEGNPVVKHKGRDPRLLWYAPGKHWVMAVYDEVEKEQCIAFYTSPDLKTWTFQNRIAGFYECPDIFQLSGKWVLTAANSDYMVGTFDGKKFTPETPKLKGHLGKGFYAAQTFSDEPKGRVVQIGWLQTTTPGMPFNQAMSLPLELGLRDLRMTWTPVEELKSLREGPAKRGELLEVRAEFDADVTFTIRGATISYNAAKHEIVVNDRRAPAPLVDGKQRLIVYVDRTVLEVFASDGLTYVPMPFTPKPEDQSVAVTGGKVRSLEVYKLKSCWNRE